MKDEDIFTEAMNASIQHAIDTRQELGYLEVLCNKLHLTHNQHMDVVDDLLDTYGYNLGFQTKFDYLQQLTTYAYQLRTDNFEIQRLF